MPGGDECEFYDSSDTVQKLHGPNAAEAENICDPQGGPGPTEVPESDVPYQTADEGARPLMQAEKEVAPLRRSTRLRFQPGCLSDYVPQVSLKIEGECGKTEKSVAFWIFSLFWKWEF